MFKKGDILEGSKKKFEEAYHYVVFISGQEEAPLAVILTHDDKYRCNIKLSDQYKLSSKEYNGKPTYFVAHLIEKMSEWRPYKKVARVSNKDLNTILFHIKGSPMTWFQYLKYTKNSCPEHKKVFSN